MAKFALTMGDGVTVSRMAELREHFDLKEAIKHLGNGRLMKWLRDRGYDDEADALDTLKEECKGNHPELAKRLCAILGVDFDETKIDAGKLEGLAELSRKAERLGQYTSDAALLATADRAAFDQADLDRLARDGNPDIYLCNGTFTIPLEQNGKHYYGIGNAVAVIPGGKNVDFEALRITFDKKHTVKFDDAYEPIYRENEYMKKAKEALDVHDYAKGAESLMKAAEMGNSEAMLALGRLHCSGEGGVKDYYEATKWFHSAADHHAQGAAEELFMLGIVWEEGKDAKQSFIKAVKCYKKAAEAGHTDAMLRLGQLYRKGDNVKRDDAKAREYFVKAAEAGNAEAMNEAGAMFQEGLGGSEDRQAAKAWYEKAANAGFLPGMRNLAELYRNEDEYSKAKAWYEKAADEGDGYAAYQVAKMYLEGQGVPEDEKKAEAWKQKAEKMGYSEGLSTTTKVLAGAAVVGALAFGPVTASVLGISGALSHFFGSKGKK